MIDPAFTAAKRPLQDWIWDLRAGHQRALIVLMILQARPHSTEKIELNYNPTKVIKHTCKYCGKVFSNVHYMKHLAIMHEDPEAIAIRAELGDL